MRKLFIFLTIVAAACQAPVCAKGLSLPDAVQFNNSTGWQIFPGQGYRYGPSIIINADNSIDMWFAASCYDGVHWDQIRYRHSDDGGRTWEQPDDVVVVTPTDGSPDRYSCCDPGAIRFGGYYYVGYTSVDNTPGCRNHVFLARSKSPRGPYLKWNGAGWGEYPQPFLRFTGDPKAWGCGEPSFVLKEGRLYVFYTWNDGKINYTDLAICENPFMDDWPAHMELKGHVLAHDGQHGEDSMDVKYVDSMGRFVAIATYNRIFSVNATVSAWQSLDGISWERVPFRGARVQTGAHNIGMSGDEFGHVDTSKKNFISYSYGWPGKDFTGQAFGWANWATFMDPITLTTTTLGQPVNVEVSSARSWDWSGPNVIDGDPKTAWSSAKHVIPQAREWVYVNLGGQYAVSGLKLQPRAGGLCFPVDFTLQYSSDGAVWKDIKSYTSYPKPGDKPLSLMFGPPVTASYFRLLATRLSPDERGDYYLQLAEISVLRGR
jgi:hypothetical protein